MHLHVGSYSHFRSHSHLLSHLHIDLDNLINVINLVTLISARASQPFVASQSLGLSIWKALLPLSPPPGLAHP